MERRVVASLCALVLTVLLTTPAFAQNAVMTVEFVNIAAAGPTERIVVFVGATACASIEIGPDSPPAAILGTTGQPAACGAEGSEVTFLQFRPGNQQLELFTRTSFMPGATYELVNWAPQPPGTPIPGYMETFVAAGGVIEPATSGNAGFSSADSGPTLGVLTVALLGTLVFIISGRAVTSRRPID